MTRKKEEDDGVAIDISDFDEEDNASFDFQVTGDMLAEIESIESVRDRAGAYLDLYYQFLPERWREGLKYLEEAKNLTEKISEKAHQDTKLKNVAAAYARDVGDFKTARELCAKMDSTHKKILVYLSLAEAGDKNSLREAIDWADKIVEPVEKSDSLFYIGYHHRHFSDKSKAIKFFERAADIAKQIADKGKRSTRMKKIAEAFEFSGNSGRAKEFRAMVKVPPRRPVEIAIDLARSENETNPKSALKHLQTAIKEALALRGKRQKPKYLEEIGLIYMKMGKLDEAYGIIDQMPEAYDRFSALIVLSNCCGGFWEEKPLPKELQVQLINEVIHRIKKLFEEFPDEFDNENRLFTLESLEQTLKMASESDD